MPHVDPAQRAEMLRTVHKPPWSKRSVATAGALLAVSAVAVALAPPLRAGDPAAGAGADAASIAREPSYQDPALLARALALPVAAAYVAAGLEYQRNASFCGPTTAVDVARSLGTPSDPAHALDGTGVRTWFGYVWGGLDLDAEAALLRARTGRRVTVLRDLDLGAFREEVARANDPERRYAVNFGRAPLFGRGGGHHSPVGAYLADRDLVLVLDVNRHYQPWLVSTERLFRAVDTVDRATGKKRGLLRVE
ncbi:MAG: phytochelatin synthase family protein [Anaeromyxobacteraceae bacterium]